MVWTSTRRCGLDCAPSTTVTAPAAWASLESCAAGFTVPSAFETYGNATILGFASNARPGIHEPGDGCTGGFVRFRRLDRQGIRAPVHVGVVEAVVVDDRVDDSSRLLTGRRVIEIHEPLPILLLLQNRELGSDPGGVEHQKSRADSVVTGSALFCSAACSACQARLAHL